MTAWGSHEELKFYLQFAKSMSHHLNDPRDKYTAASWIVNLQRESFGPIAARINFSKLLLLAIQKEKLTGPFACIPNSCKTLLDYKGSRKFSEIAKEFIEEKLEKDKTVSTPSYQFVCSWDNKEYASTQEVPNFGTQVYFATSSEPMSLWYNSSTNKTITRKHIKPKATTWKLNEKRSESLVKGVTCPNLRKPPSWGSNLLNLLDTRPDVRKSNLDED